MLYSEQRNCKRGNGDGVISRDRNAFENRVENEAAAYVAAANRGIKAVFKKMNVTLAKDLGGKGKAKYLKTLDTSAFPGFSELQEKKQEAIIAGWSALE